MKTRIIAILTIVMSLTLTACNKDDPTPNLFTLSQDIQFGKQLETEIASNPTEYPLLSKAQYPEAYQHIERIRDAIKASDNLNHAKDFEWKVYIIDKDVLNAFAAPGGYMYFYTGLIKFLDNEAELAGVMAHEMAHADRRHSTVNMTKAYGLDILISILLGDNASQMKEIAASMAQGLANLRFSRENEYEADEYAITYLYDTDYYPKGIAGFFEKLQKYQTDNNKTPEFLSTHPSDDNRLAQMDKVWTDLGSKQGELFVERYAQFKASLPAH